MLLGLGKIREGKCYTHDGLSADWADLNLDVDDTKRLSADIYLHQAWVD